MQSHWHSMEGRGEVSLDVFGTWIPLIPKVSAEATTWMVHVMEEQRVFKRLTRTIRNERLLRGSFFNNLAFTVREIALYPWYEWRVVSGINSFFIFCFMFSFSRE